MSEPLLTQKAAVSVSEMAEACNLSRTSFYRLMQAGVFPRPVLHPSSKRPIFDPTLQQKCLEIRRTGIGLHGHPVLFNRKSRAVTKPRKITPEPKADHADLLAALKALGLTTNADAVRAAVAALFPTGLDGLAEGDVVRRVFLHLQGKK